METNFSDWSSEVQSFKPTAKPTRETSVTQAQTDFIQMAEQSTQATESNTIDTQTEDHNAGGDTLDKDKPYPPSLFAFFARVTDPICEYLRENSEPLMNAAFQQLNVEDEIETKKEAELLYTLRNKAVPDDFAGTCLAWNSTGSQIAVGYGQTNHEKWCTHRVPLSIWNTNRKQNFETSIPHSQIVMSSCITAVEFHPTDSSILAVGLFSGEIALVDSFKDASQMDTKHEETSVTKNNKKRGESYVSESCGHNMSITCVKWIQPEITSYEIISSSKDGHICLWSVNGENTWLQLKRKFVVWSDSLADEVKVGNRHFSGMKEIGVTQLSCCKGDPYTSVFCTFGSFVFQGDLTSEQEAVATFEDEDAIRRGEKLYDPKAILHNKEIGCIASIDCSPFHRNIFLSTTLDGHICVHNLFEISYNTTYLKCILSSELTCNSILPKPSREPSTVERFTKYSSYRKPLNPKKEFFIAKKTSEMVTDIKWSGRPMMFAATEAEKLAVFDLLLSDKPTLWITHNESLLKIAFNFVNIGIVAVSDVKGSVSVWKLPKSMSSHEPNEMDALIELGQAEL